MFAIGDKEWPGISKLSEEAGEVLQVVGKLMGTGGETKHWNVSDLKEALEDELGDLAAAIDFVVARCNLDKQRVHEQFMRKLAIFNHWHEKGHDPR